MWNLVIYVDMHIHVFTHHYCSFEQQSFFDVDFIKMADKDCVMDSGWNQENQPKLMTNRDEWWDWGKGIYDISISWWWLSKNIFEIIIICFIHTRHFTNVV